MLFLANKLWQWLEVVIGLLLIAMIALVFVNVVLRYGFASGLRSSIELSRLAFVWLIMLGAACALRKNEHITVDEFLPAVAPWALPVVSRLIWLAILVPLVMLIIGSWRQMIADWPNTSPLTGLPGGLIYVPGVISGVLMVITAAIRIYRPSPKDGKS